MKRLIEFKHIDERFVLAEDEKILFEINDKTLKFDSLSFYNGIYKNKSSAIELRNSTDQKVKNSTYIFNWLHELIESISHELNDAEPDENGLTGDELVMSEAAGKLDANGRRIIPLFDFAVCAGNGDFIDESIGHQDFSTENEEADYALIISGDSMAPTIPNGSIVLVKKVTELSNKDIAIVSTGSEAMCKRYIKRGKGIFLKPDNPAYKEYSKKDCLTFLIRGKVIETIKP